MAKREWATEEKRLNTDLGIIVAISLCVLGVYIALQNQLMPIWRDGSINILRRLLLAASFQFGLAGLGITIVCVIRKESFLSFGLRAKGTILSICLCVLCFVPNIIFTAVMGDFKSYLPLQMVDTTREILASGFPINATGMILTAIVWGFFEGFNYVVISDKINKRFPSKNRWLNWGAIICAVLCILIHGAIGITPEGIIEMLTILIIIYGMLMVKDYTKNAWGCVFIFVLLWNAF